MKSDLGGGQHGSPGYVLTDEFSVPNDEKLGRHSNPAGPPKGRVAAEGRNAR